MNHYKQASGQRRRPHYTQAPSVRERSATGIALVVLVTLFAAIGGVLAYYFLLNPEVLISGGKQPETVIKTRIINFADARFSFPGYTYNKTRRNAVGVKIGIRLLVPTDWTKDSKPRVYTRDSALEDWIIINIERKNPTRANQVWLKRIYRQYIDGPATAHKTGLFRYQFRTGTPYSDLDLFVDDLEAPKVMIRCERQNTNLNARLCARHLAINSKIVANYRFSRLQMQNWKQLHEVVVLFLRAAYSRTGA